MYAQLFRGLTLALATFAASHAAALDVQFDSGTTRGHLVELFTSEGCSSCPPADRWLSTLKRDERLWKTVFPVAFHVDYWDYIGWPDRFAQPGHSQRQREHRGLGNVYSVYTPGFVVAGREWRGWFNGDALPVHERDDAPVRIRVQLRDGAGVDQLLSAQITGDQALPPNLQLHLAILGMDLETDVRDGENAGRKLSHDFVALRWYRWPLKIDGANASLAAPIRLPTTDAPRLAASLWVSVDGTQRPLQAVGGFLE